MEMSIGTGIAAGVGFICLTWIATVIIMLASNRVRKREDET